MSANYAVVAERAGHRCECSHAPKAIFNFPLEVEHVIPVSMGGPDDESNKALACRSYNLFKSNHQTAVDVETGNRVQLFNPRIDNWTEHFRFDLESGRVIGRTPIGRATMERLRMNSQLQLDARQVWMRLGLLQNPEGG